MNKRVLKTMIILCWVFLVAYALLKTIPQLANRFVIAVNNERLVKVGAFIDSQVWLQQIVYGLTTLLTYHFYLCACIKRWHLSIKQTIISLVVIIPNQVLTYFYPQIGSVVSFVIMFCLPCVFRADYRTVAIIFATHILGQLAISYIRSQELYLVDLNTITQLVMLLDMYVWLLLYYLYSNLYKEKKFMGTAAPPLWGNMAAQIKKEIANLDKKIAECNNEKKRAKLQEKRAEYEQMLVETSNEK